jgi:hypothetical protein
MIVTRLGNNVIYCKKVAADGTISTTDIGFARMKFDYDDEETTKRGIKFTRTQFPLKLNYAATIHKGQGLTISGKEGVDLRSNVWQAGQLNVALGRITRGENIFVVTGDDYGRVRNVVWKWDKPTRPVAARLSSPPPQQIPVIGLPAPIQPPAIMPPPVVAMPIAIPPVADVQRPLPLPALDLLSITSPVRSSAAPAPPPSPLPSSSRVPQTPAVDTPLRCRVPADNAPSTSRVSVVDAPSIRRAPVVVAPQNGRGRGRRVDVGKDGNCFFRAISLSMYGTQDHYWELRRRAYDNILQLLDGPDGAMIATNLWNYFPTVANPDDPSSVGRPLRQYLRELRNNNVYAGVAEAPIMASYLNQAIVYVVHWEGVNTHERVDVYHPGTLIGQNLAGDLGIPVVADDHQQHLGGNINVGEYEGDLFNNPMNICIWYNGVGHFNAILFDQ